MGWRGEHAIRLQNTAYRRRQRIIGMPAVAVCRVAAGVAILRPVMFAEPPLSGEDLGNSRGEGNA